LVDEYNNMFNEIDSTAAVIEIRKIYSRAIDPRTDAFSACTHKHNLYLLKCLIEDLYEQLPEFPNQEKEWAQERLLEILKK